MVFFCEIKYPNKFSRMHILITNRHLILSNMIKNKEYIEIKFNNEIKKISNSNRKIWEDEFLDFICIEILREDDIITEPFRNR